MLRSVTFPAAWGCKAITLRLAPKADVENMLFKFSKLPTPCLTAVRPTKPHHKSRLEMLLSLSKLSFAKLTSLRDMLGSASGLAGSGGVGSWEACSSLLPCPMQQAKPSGPSGCGNAHKVGVLRTVVRFQTRGLLLLGRRHGTGVHLCEGWRSQVLSSTSPG